MSTESRVACVPSCWNARSPVSECECFCGGENHGLGYGGMRKRETFNPVRPDSMQPGSVPGHYSAPPGGGGTVYNPDGRPVDLKRSLALANHSPTGFGWGYMGSGPHQLALAILLDNGLSPNAAQQHYRRFAREVVAHCHPDQQLKLRRSHVEGWIRQHVTGISGRGMA